MEIDDEILYAIPEEELTEEEKNALHNLKVAYDRVFVLSLRRQFGLDVAYIDDDHIMLDGKVTDVEAFLDWLELRLIGEDTKSTKLEGKVYKA